MKNLMISIMLAGLAACSSIQTHWDYNPDVDFSQYHTYAWIIPKQGDSDYHMKGFEEQRVHRALDDQMAQLGMTKVSDPNNADLKVNYLTKIDQKFDVDTFNDNFGYNPGFYGGFGPGFDGGFGPGFDGGFGPGFEGGYGPGFDGGYDTQVREYDVKTLFIDFIDAKTNKLVWRGSASNVIDMDAIPTNRIKEVNKAVEKIMANYPPTPAGS